MADATDELQLRSCRARRHHDGQDRGLGRKKYFACWFFRNIHRPIGATVRLIQIGKSDFVAQIRFDNFIASHCNGLESSLFEAVLAEQWDADKVACLLRGGAKDTPKP